MLDDWQNLGGRVTLSTLADLKATWGIAIKALVVRFQQLGIIDADQATSLYKQISKRGWNKAEPVSATNEEPIWLSRAMAQRTGAATGPAAAPVAAQMTGLSDSYLRLWLDWSPVPTSVDVVGLPTRRHKPRSANVPTGQILTFPPRRTR